MSAAEFLLCQTAQTKNDYFGAFLVRALSAFMSIVQFIILLAVIKFEVGEDGDETCSCKGRMVSFEKDWVSMEAASVLALARLASILAVTERDERLVRVMLPIMVITGVDHWKEL